MDDTLILVLEPARTKKRWEMNVVAESKPANNMPLPFTSDSRLGTLVRA
jgi:hypothetical protein